MVAKKKSSFIKGLLGKCKYKAMFGVHRNGPYYKRIIQYKEIVEN